MSPGMLPDLVRFEVLRALGLRSSWFELLGLIPDKIRKILAGTCFVLGAILSSIVWAMSQAQSERSSTSITDGILEVIIFFFGFSLLIISAFLWPWGSTAKAIKTYVDAQVDAQVTDEEQDRMWELSRYPRSMDQEESRLQNRDSDITLGEEESQS